MATKAHLEGNKRYLDKLDDIKIRVPKGKKAEYREHALKTHDSLNSYIIDLIEKDMEKDRP